jgi:hypothetical protein
MNLFELAKLFFYCSVAITLYVHKYLRLIMSTALIKLFLSMEYSWNYSIHIYNRLLDVFIAAEWTKIYCR